MSIYLPDGYGGSNGTPFVLRRPIFQNGNVFYVSSVSGDAAETNAKDRASPIDTLAGAVALASVGDTIVLLEDHDETLTTELAIDKDLLIVGEGRASGLPTAKLTMNAAGGAGTLAVDGALLELHNVYFPEQLQGSNKTLNRHISTDVDAGLWIEDCVFEQGEFSGVGVGSSQVGDVIRRCTFLSVAATKATRGAEGFSGIAGSLRLEGCVFDAGTFGFVQSGGTTYAAQVAAVAGVRLDELSLLRGADVFIHASATRVIYSVPTSTGGGRVIY